uniref:uncharacterized protein LOC108949456 n=1 Tax=Ciona intestinalis TaxID=7719 RepID=UPI00089DC807|nr:uncharacterized protein LOC108949456 [Ciona intestinalis]|eukprot:XP_018667253.1 uncharacterized protein LOC108949456 [Ciona intestinalis]
MLSSQFFCQVDQEVVHLTNEFVSRALEQLGNKADFSHIVYEVLKHAHGMEVDDDEVAAPLFSGLHLWHDPMARTHLAKYHLKDLYQKYATSHVGIKSPSNTDTSINEKSVSSYLTEIAESPKLQARNSSVVSPKSTDINACSNDQSTFPPLSAFLQFIKDVEANQLPNHALPGKSPQSVLGVVKSCMLPTTIETVPSPDSADSDYIV